MLRQIHSLAGLVAALLVCALALTGAVLSVEPVIDRAAFAPAQTQQASVAEFAAAMQARHPGIDKIVRAPSGLLVISYFENDRAAATRVDPATLSELGPHLPSPTLRVITNLHRSFLLGDSGRIAAGIGALAMVLLTLSGTMMLAARLGGWRALLRPVRGTSMQRWHAELGRIAVVLLFLSALTGCYMSLTTHGVLPDGSSDTAITATGSGGIRVPVGDLAALQSATLASLRELTFPYAADLTDVFTLTTSDGVAHIDPATGALLDFAPHPLARQLSEIIYQLHTGQGLWPLALLLGLAALCVPVFSVTGAVIWWKRRSGQVRFAGNTSASSADTIILVGSEGNATWGFARTLHAALHEAGHTVHVAPMNAVWPAYAAVRRILILTSTYGDGAAPASANAFLAKAGLSTPVPYAVLGFGDRSFPQFCAFAEAVDSALQRQGWTRLMQVERIDRQSVSDFARWGDALGLVLGHPVTLAHVAVRPATRTFQLVARTDYGAEVQAPTSVLRFAMARGRSLWPRRMPRFDPGDLVGILPPGSAQPRFYSLASSSRDGVLEICVRKQPGGLCSGFLHDLQPGATIEAFIRSNPTFRPRSGQTPLILVGAGAGIGPLIGFIRQSSADRPVHLYWGGRNPASDFLYREELSTLLRNRKLTALRTAFSRVPGGAYVQERLVQDGSEIARLLNNGAQVLVCGGRDMAGGVARALDGILLPLGLSLEAIKAEGRYVEDVY